jgi:membrane protein implicated in regulation of membrane protease activity
VRVRLYGLFPTTRRRYVIQAAVVVLGAALVAGGWLVFWLPHPPPAADAPPALARIATLMNALPWALLALVVLQVVEASFVLRAFNRKERETRPGPPETKPQP